MRTFIYVTEDKSNKRGYNKYISVYENKDNIPNYVGDVHVNTASYYGDIAEVKQVISTKCGIEMKDSYNFVDDEVIIFEIS